MTDIHKKHFRRGVLLLEQGLFTSMLILEAISFFAYFQEDILAYLHHLLDPIQQLDFGKVVTGHARL